MAGQKALIGGVVRSLTQRDGDDQADDQVNGDGQITRRRRRLAPITDKGRGRKLKSPDSVFRGLELEAIERVVDKSKIVTALLNRHLPRFNLTKMDRPATEE